MPGFSSGVGKVTSKSQIYVASVSLTEISFPGILKNMDKDKLSRFETQQQTEKRNEHSSSLKTIPPLHHGIQWSTHTKLQMLGKSFKHLCIMNGMSDYIQEVHWLILKGCAIPRVSQL